MKTDREGPLHANGDVTMLASNNNDEARMRHPISVMKIHLLGVNS